MCIKQFLFLLSLPVQSLNGALKTFLGCQLDKSSACLCLHLAFTLSNLAIHFLITHKNQIFQDTKYSQARTYYTST